MAVFAKIVNNTVMECIVVSELDCGNKTFPDSEPIGQNYISSLGIEGTWLQTSPEGLFRGCYASQDWTYDQVLDVFVAPVRPIIE
jgi:hypothetical protein